MVLAGQMGQGKVGGEAEAWHHQSLQFRGFVAQSVPNLPIICHIDDPNPIYLQS